jgi:hypothetical protein
MDHTGPTFVAAFVASLAAGPLFLIFALGAFVCRESLRGIPVDPSLLMLDLYMFVPSLPVGFVLSFVPNYAGTWLMIGLTKLSDMNRSPIAWMLVGGFIAGLIGGVLSGQVDEFTFIFAATGASCAAICRRWIDWEPA